LLVANGSSLVAQNRAPVPSDAAQQEVLKLIQEVYGEDHAQAETAAEKTALAHNLVKEAGQSQDLTTRYVLLRVARDLATQAGDVESAWQVVEEIAKSFQVDVFRLKGAAVSQARQSASSTEQRKAIAEHSLALIDEALARDDFVAAKYLGEVALDSARRAREGDLTRRVVAKNREITEVAEAFEGVKDALQRLEENPTDPEANLMAGRYFGVLKGDWRKAIPMLALGSDDELKELAVIELQGVTDVGGQVALGDGWWKLAETKDDRTKDRLRERAIEWYRLASPKLTGFAKTRVEKRLETGDELIASASKPERSASPPRVAKPRGPQRYYLSDMNGFDIRRGPWEFETTLRVLPNGTRCRHSLQMHPPTRGYSRVKFQLNKEFMVFAGGVIISRSSTGSEPLSTITFLALGDGQPLWQSAPMKALERPVFFGIRVSNVEVLELRVICPGHNERAHAYWLDPYVLKTGR